MKCSQIQKLLSNYLDESVSKQERTVIEEHLKTCVDCQGEIEILRRLGKTLDLTDNIQPTTDFTHQVLNEVRKPEAPVRYSMSFFLQLKTWAFSVAAIAIVFVTVLFGNYMGRTIYMEYAERKVKQEPPNTNIYQYGLCYEIPDSSFSAIYLNLKNGGAP